VQHVPLELHTAGGLELDLEEPLVYGLGVGAGAGAGAGGGFTGSPGSGVSPGNVS
jgi:hypothetical protein